MTEDTFIFNGSVARSLIDIDGFEEIFKVVTPYFSLYKTYYFLFIQKISPYNE